MSLHNFKKGDFVAVIDEDIKGVVVSVHGNRITFEDENGFPNYYNAKRLILRKPLHDLMTDKIIVKDKKSVKTTKKISNQKSGFLEVDLHIHQITNSNRNWSNHQIVQYQLNYAKQKMAYAIKNRISKIVFIHGKGKGVLKEELTKMLKQFPVEIKDASYQKYGLGATEVSIFLSKTKR